MAHFYCRRLRVKKIYFPFKQFVGCFYQQEKNLCFVAKKWLLSTSLPNYEAGLKFSDKAWVLNGKKRH